MTVKIGDIQIGERFRKDMGDIGGLAASMRDQGLIHPIVVDTDTKLVAGRRRLEAAKQLGWTEIECSIMDFSLERQRDENTVREPFSPSDAWEIGQAILDREQKAANAVGITKNTFKKLDLVMQAAKAEPSKHSTVVLTLAP